MNHRIQWLLGCSLVLFLPLANASFAGQPYLYKSPYSLGMGGADLASSGSANALFANPAGLVSGREGFQFNPFAVTAGTTGRAVSFIRQLDEGLSIRDADDQRDALFKLIKDYRGQNIHGQLATLGSLSWRGLVREHPLALSLAWLSTQSLDARTHQGFGGDGLISINHQEVGGFVAGAALQQGHWRLGIAAKDLRRRQLAGSYSPRQLIQIARDDAHDFSDEYTRGRAQSLDLGLQYQFRTPYLDRAHLAVVTRNLGGLDFADAGKLPQTWDLGLAVYPPGPGVASMVISADYVDVLHRTEPVDDLLRRTRLGIRIQAPRQGGVTLSASAGLYQNALTAGIEVDVPLVRLSLVTYAQEQGVYAGQDPERRYLLGLSFQLNNIAGFQR